MQSVIALNLYSTYTIGIIEQIPLFIWLKRKMYL